MFSLYGGYGGLMFGGRSRGRKASKPKKAKKENWFERLTVDQNKQLCKAAKLRHVGNKKDLINRLLDESQTSIYGPEEKYIGINVEAIKAKCRNRSLQVSGNKFDLVLRILHCDNDSTPEGATLKRAATNVVSTVDAATGKLVEKHVAKKRKKPALSASRVASRVQKKIEAVTQKKYQSHWGSKTHSSDVYGLVADILYSEIVRSDENYLSKDPRFALSIAEAACTSLTDNFDTMCRKGYDDEGGWETIDSSLRTIAEAAKPILSAEEREEAAEWIEALHNEGDGYGLTMDTELMATVEFIRGNNDGKKSEENEEAEDTTANTKAAAAAPPAAALEDDRKPAAAPAAPTAKTNEGALKVDSHVAKENVVNSSVM